MDFSSALWICKAVPTSTMNILVSVFCESTQNLILGGDTGVVSFSIAMVCIWNVFHRLLVWTFNLKSVALFWEVLKTSGSGAFYEEVDNWTWGVLKSSNMSSILVQSFSVSWSTEMYAYIPLLLLTNTQTVMSSLPWYAICSQTMIPNKFFSHKLFLFSIIISILF